MKLRQSWRPQTWGAGLGVMALALGLSAPALTAPPAQAEPPAETNVALASEGGVVTASGQEKAGQWGPELVNDGDTSEVAGASGSRWSSNHSDDAWIQVELAEPTIVDHVTIYWEDACAAKYKLQTSTDGTSWTDATGEIEPTCGTVDDQVLDTPEPVEFVRMQALDRTPIGGSKWGVSMWEFQVWADLSEPTPAEGQNIALASAGAMVGSSGTEVSDGRWTADLATDGDRSTRWSSNTSDDAWIQVELAEPTVVDHVTIYWEAAYAARFKLQSSTNGTDWTDLTAELTGSEGRQEIPITTGDPVAYVRMQSIERSGTYGVSLFEFEVWDGPEPTPVTPEASLVPLPAYVDWAGEDAEPFRLTDATRILAEDGLAGEAALLAASLRGSTGFDVPIETGTAGASASDIVLTTGDLDQAVADAGLADASLAENPLDGGAETYQLDVSAAGAIVTGASAHGVFNGTQTLLQLLPEFVYSPTAVATDWAAPAVTIVDSPRYDYRAIMLDPARSFLTVDEVKHVLDAMANAKMSALHLHLADDQGWRIEITNEGKADDDPIDYTRLTEISGKTAMNKLGATYKDELGHTGYYTQEDYTDIVTYAAERHITVVPEIDLPGHTNAALHAIPELNTAGSSHEGTAAEPTAPANGSGDVGYSYLDPDSELSFTFIEHVLGQIAALTPGEYLHIGGDESHAMTSRYGIDGFNEFVARTIQIVHDLDKKPIGWSEIAAGTLNPGDGVQYWVGGTADITRAVTQEGAKVLVSRGGNSYIDMKYNPKTPIGLTWACSGICDFDRYYDWNPAATIDGVDDPAILGNEAPMWSETIRGGYQAEFLAFPRAFSHAEIGWSQQSDRNVAEFAQRMATQGVRMLAGGWNFYDGDRAVWDTALVGTDLEAKPGADVTFDVGLLAAPGTTTDGASVAVDTVDDEDGVSRSSLDGPLTATVDFGDGTAAQQVTFSTEQARDSLHAGSLYTIEAGHAYATAGEYTGTITGSDGSVATFTARIAADAENPSEPVSPWDPAATPTVTFTDDDAEAGARTQVSISGFEPGKHVALTFDGAPSNSVIPGDDGTITVWWQVPPASTNGEKTLVATQGERSATDAIVVTDGRLTLADPIDQSLYTVADVSSQETVGEPAGSGVATAAIDGDPATYWHTQWQGTVDPDGSDQLPHHITLDLGGQYDVQALEYMTRQSGTNGRIADYDIYVSSDGTTWGDPVVTGTFSTALFPQVVEFAPVEGRFVKLVAKTSQAGNEFAGAAEIRIGGLPADEGGGDDDGTADSSGGADDGTADASGSGTDAGADADSSGSGTDADADSSGSGTDAGADADSSGTDAGADADSSGSGTDAGADADSSGSATDTDADSSGSGTDTGADADSSGSGTDADADSSGAGTAASADASGSGAGTDADAGADPADPGADSAGAGDGSDGGDGGGRGAGADALPTVPGADEPGDLPDTGASVLPAALIACLVILGGVALLVRRGARG
ncbi:family 20 glycosylhydrolase [Pseudactinotalea sp. HY160]|uniref:family 20 glycosylhydrolase n=1 Tax=Pseudactinotalea sp. HY160 TaxID=2654490 RepID=UPI00128AE3B9|nr:family 20 glycosylhydrolase [Pseudactinotalea sp. HY160]MPV48664.1 family 20 glycosylhydrolase [Pseudactinotalea sp. HY160]